MMSSRKTLALSLVIFSTLWSTLAWAHGKPSDKPHTTVETVPNVVVSIAPLHSLVAGVMEGLGEPKLLLKGNQTPHHYQLSPSDAQALAQANVVIYTSKKTEIYIPPLLAAIPERKPLTIEAMTIPGITLYPVAVKEGAPKGIPVSDMHFWLDPMNAIAFTQHIATILSEKDPDHKSFYAVNAKKQNERLKTLYQDTHTLLKSKAGKGGSLVASYASYHPVLQYFEKRYQIKPGLVITRTPESGATMSEMGALESAIKSGAVTCLFSEPQFSPKLLTKMADTYEQAHIHTLDPIGATLEPGATLYGELIRNMAGTISKCLKPTLKKEPAIAPAGN
ncbi:MAG: zinc ABC transporter substrate-binding protein [Rickettsiales bacterium]